MSRRQYGTRFITGCGHSWRKRYPKWTVGDLRGVVTDCRVCDAYLIIPFEQFDGMDRSVFPVEVHMPMFHKYMNEQDERWPVDGVGTGYVEFTTEEKEKETKA